MDRAAFRQTAGIGGRTRDGPARDGAAVRPHTHYSILIY